MISNDTNEVSDLFVIGGGVNGCGIARDAAGRGLKVVLAEKDDLASGTSSASTKLFHGGLRYLEYFEIRLVREALRERETLLSAMPHISWPMRFVLPLHKDMRFETTTPASRLLNRFLPWMKGQRPAWMIRLGLFLYDHMGGRKVLPATSRVNLQNGPEGAPLNEKFRNGFEYSDCWVDDARLVALNARDAANLGAEIMVRHEVTSAKPVAGVWEITTIDHRSGAEKKHHARCLVNASGPWVGDVVNARVTSQARDTVRLVRGSHIVTRRLYEHDKSYFLQGRDGRIIFVIPYEDDFTLIGTTDADHPSPDDQAVCTDAERDYLINFANKYLKKQISTADVVWTYAGVRPLLDDQSESASAATRDYKLKVELSDGAPVLHVFGGKITTYRKLAESAMASLGEFFPEMPDKWTGGAPLPGGDFALNDKPVLAQNLAKDFPFLDLPWAKRLIRSYGTDSWKILGSASTVADLGQDFGGTLYQREVDWMIDREFASKTDDIIWRRSKLGLRLSEREVEELDKFVRDRTTSSNRD